MFWVVICSFYLHRQRLQINTFSLDIGISSIHLGAPLESVVAVCFFNRERKRLERQKAASSLQSAPTLSTKQQEDTERLHKEHKIQNIVHMNNLKVGAGTMCV